MPQEPVPPCPVCGKELKNRGGLAAHVKVTKDLDHEQYRRDHPDLRAALFGPDGPARPAPEAGDPEPGGSGEVEPGPDGGSEQVEKVTFRAPRVVSPLLEVEPDPEPDPDAGGTPDPAPEDKGEGVANGADTEGEWEVVDEQAEPEEDEKRPAWVRPEGEPIPEGTLEPFIAGGVAQVVNAFYLNGEADERLARQEVGDTGFPLAVEKALMYYFPELAWDHPLVLVFISGMGLASAIGEKKAKTDDEGASEEPKGEDEQQAQAIVAEPSDGPEQPESTGSDYWAGIQAQAGGSPQ